MITIFPSLLWQCVKWGLGNIKSIQPVKIPVLIVSKVLFQKRANWQLINPHLAGKWVSKWRWYCGWVVHNAKCTGTINLYLLKWWRWELLGPDGVAPIRMVGVSASVNLPLHHKVQKFSSGTGSPGWSRKKGRKTVVVVVVVKSHVW